MIKSTSSIYRPVTLDDIEFKEIKEYIKLHSGISIADNKKYLIVQRLSPFVRKANCKSFKEYIKKLNSCSLRGESNKVIDAMTTNETSFFRDQKPFDLLKNKILSQVILDAKNKRQNHVTIWSAGASTGQEAYSLAILIYEYCKYNKTDYKFEDFRIIATDISEEVLKKAQKGIYSNVEMDRGLEQINKNLYFKQENNKNWKVQDFLKKIITFKSVNLLHNFSNIPTSNIIFCRNVLIYFEQDTQNLILQRLYNALSDDGLLFLGAMEGSYNALDKYKKFNTKTYTIYQK